MTDQPQTTPTLKKLIETDRQERLAACQALINAALQQHRCTLAAIPQITPDGRIIAHVLLQVSDS